MKIELKVSIEIISIEHHVENEVEAVSLTKQTNLEAFKQPTTDSGFVNSLRKKHNARIAELRRSDSGRHHRCSRCGTLARRRLNGLEGCKDCMGWSEETLAKVQQWRMNIDAGRKHNDNGVDE